MYGFEGKKGRLPNYDCRLEEILAGTVVFLSWFKPEGRDDCGFFLDEFGCKAMAGLWRPM
jgi:hypothetical protein